MSRRPALQPVSYTSADNTLFVFNAYVMLYSGNYRHFGIHLLFFLMVGPSSIGWRHVCFASIPVLFLVRVVVSSLQWVYYCPTRVFIKDC